MDEQQTNDEFDKYLNNSPKFTLWNTENYKSFFTSNIVSVPFKNNTTCKSLQKSQNTHLGLRKNGEKSNCFSRTSHSTQCCIHCIHFVMCIYKYVCLLTMSHLLFSFFTVLKLIHSLHVRGSPISHLNGKKNQFHPA